MQVILPGIESKALWCFDNDIIKFQVEYALMQSDIIYSLGLSESELYFVLTYSTQPGCI